MNDPVQLQLQRVHGFHSNVAACAFSGNRLHPRGLVLRTDRIPMEGIGELSRRRGHDHHAPTFSPVSRECPDLSYHHAPQRSAAINHNDADTCLVGGQYKSYIPHRLQSHRVASRPPNCILFSSLFLIGPMDITQ